MDAAWYLEEAAMAMTVRATYIGGVLRPDAPLTLAEGESVDLTITPTPAAATPPPPSDDEIVRQFQACKSYHEWLELTKSLPADDGGYDIVNALNDNRRWSGEQPLLPENGGQR
jgi:predicted DNA-binding antitoxin AbrB/MazE fold protein